MLTIIFPMAGRGQRFVDAGYATPKPFVDVAGKPMIQRVWENLPKADAYVFVARWEHAGLLRGLMERTGSPGGRWDIVLVDGDTAGPSSTVLRGAHLVDDRSELLCADCDAWPDWSPEHFRDFTRRTSVAGVLVTFRSQSPAYAYAKVDAGGAVTFVGEKVVLGPDAITAPYYWKRASACFGAIRLQLGRFVDKGERTIAPCYNELIAQGCRVETYPVPRLWSFGTPEALQYALVHGPWGGHGPDGRTPEGWREV